MENNSLPTDTANDKRHSYVSGLMSRFRRLGANYKILILVLTIVLLQLLIPSGLVGKNTYINNQNFGFQTTDAIQSKINSNSETLELEASSIKHSYSLRQTGVRINTDQTLTNIESVTFLDKLIPLWPVYILSKDQHASLNVSIDEDQLDEFATRTAKMYELTPSNASIKLSDGDLIVKEENTGIAVSPDKIKQSIKSADFLNETTISLDYDVKPAKITTDDFRAIEEACRDLKDTALTVVYGEFRDTIEHSEVINSIQVSFNKPDAKWRLTFKEEKIDELFSKWQSRYSKPPGVTQVVQFGNAIVSSRGGNSGRSLNRSKVKTQLNSWLNNPSSEEIVLSSDIIAPSVEANDNFSRNSQQLQASLNAWMIANGGKYQVAIVELGGKGRQASYIVKQKTAMASTYKLFLAYVAYIQAEKDLLDLDYKLSTGHSISSCIEVMIVSSNNDCAVALGKYIGWEKVDSLIHDAGFKGVKLNNYDSSGNLNGDKLVNAGELAKFLARLSSGKLMNSKNTNNLLSHMKAQIYREGIPAGSPNSTVANKVGFLSGYLHDSAIVYGSQSTYALVIMSEGSSWKSIKDLSAAIYKFMNH